MPCLDEKEPQPEATEIRLPAKVRQIGPLIVRMSRSRVRQAGLAEIRRQLRHEFPQLTRTQLRKLSRGLQQDAWQARDREAVARLKTGVEVKPPQDRSEDPNYWRGARPWRDS